MSRSAHPTQTRLAGSVSRPGVLPFGHGSNWPIESMRVVIETANANHNHSPREMTNPKRALLNVVPRFDRTELHLLMTFRIIVAVNRITMALDLDELESTDLRRLKDRPSSIATLVQP